MNKDLVSNVTSAVSLNPAARASGTGTGATVDTQGYDSAYIEFTFGAVTDGTHTPSVQHSADGTTWTDAGTDGALAYPSSVGTALQPVTSAGTGLNGGTSVQRVGYIGNNRYLRGMLAVAAGTTGALSGANVVLGHPALAPIA